MSIRLPLQAKARSAPSAFLIPVQGGLFQRKCACGGSAWRTGECSECRSHHLTLQRRAADQAGSSTGAPIVDEVLQAPGQPLDNATRAFMESRFGHDFSQVRVHTDARAAESAQAVNALAYTVGPEVVFGAGQYAPGTRAGHRLLAHELAHVVQQRAVTSSLQQVAVVGRSEDPNEREADLAADRIAAGFLAQTVRPLTSVTIQRQPVKDEKPTTEPLTRAEEIKLSRTSPGQVTGSTRPFVLSLYNFAIDKAELKELHEGALRELGALIKRANPEGVYVVARGHADVSG